MQCFIMENTLIKLTLHDETKKSAHDSQIIRAKENLKLSHGGSVLVNGSSSHPVWIILKTTFMDDDSSS